MVSLFGRPSELGLKAKPRSWPEEIQGLRSHGFGVCVCVCVIGGETTISLRFLPSPPNRCIYLHAPNGYQVSAGYKSPDQVLALQGPSERSVQREGMGEDAWKVEGEF